jgi:hypothetical protein
MKTCDSLRRSVSDVGHKVAHEHEAISDLFIDFSDENLSAAALALAAASASMATQSGTMTA